MASMSWKHLRDILSSLDDKEDVILLSRPVVVLMNDETYEIDLVRSMSSDILVLIPFVETYEAEDE